MKVTYTDRDSRGLVRERFGVPLDVQRLSPYAWVLCGPENYVLRIVPGIFRIRPVREVAGGSVTPVFGAGCFVIDGMNI